MDNMEENKDKENNKGCAIFILIILSLSIFGILEGIFSSNEEKEIKKHIITNSLTIESTKGLDTALIIKSIYSIFRDEKLKENIDNTSLEFEKSEAYRISIPDGLDNIIVIVKLKTEQLFDNSNSIKGSINTLKNNPEVSNLIFSIRDTLIKDIPAKYSEGTFKAMGEEARFKYISFRNHNKAYFLSFINKTNDKKAWVEIQNLIKDISVK